MAAKQTRKKPPADTRSVEDKLIDAALDLAAERRWRDISMGDIADAAGVDIGEALLALPTKTHLLRAFARRTDATVFGSLAEDPLDGSTKDKLFDLLMRRFDAHEGRKEALESITRDMLRDPAQAVCMAPALDRAMARTLEAAGAATVGLRGVLRTKALGGIYLAAADAWFKDVDPGLAGTMARLDKALGRAERLEQGGGCLRSRGRAAGTAAVSE